MTAKNQPQGSPHEDAYMLADEQTDAGLEALLFAAGDPLSFDRIQAITSLDPDLLRRRLQDLSERLARDPGRGLVLRQVEDAYFLATKPALKELLARLLQPRHQPPLSQAAYETLAVVAYNQPVTRAQVEAVRGVNSDSIILRLVERNLIQEAGQLDSPGRPILYETSERFLLDFGIRSVRDLPPMELLMYQTLQDFEATLTRTNPPGTDRQISLDQWLDRVSPDPDADPVQATGRPQEAPPLSDQSVLAVSGALFGQQADAQAEPEAVETDP